MTYQYSSYTNANCVWQRIHRLTIRIYFLYTGKCSFCYSVNAKAEKVTKQFIFVSSRQLGIVKPCCVTYKRKFTFNNVQS